MIQWPAILQLLGFFLLGISAFFVLPLGLAVYEADPGVGPLTLALLVGMVVGGSMAAFFKNEGHEITRREGILLVVLAWISAVGIGSLPFYFSAWFPGLTDAYFEAMSGFTTTGATILTDIEAVPRSLLLWRALTHWLGGMGIIVLGIAVLPLLGTGGMELYRAEFSGARSEKLKPRVAETALALWKIYVSLSVAEYVALRLAGMEAFDSICHTFATVATGGFSTRAASVEAYQSPAIEYIIVIFMILAGINFTLHYRLFVQRRLRPFFTDPEVKAFLGVILVASILLALPLIGPDVSVEKALRLSLFQVVSIQTTTGFSSADFELWTPFSSFTLFLLMFIGGCTGSTAGGMKMARIVMLKKVVGREFRRMVERRGVFTIRFGGRAVSEQTVGSVLNLVYLTVIIVFSASLALTATGVDFFTSLSAVVASMFNIGPGFGDVGPTEHYGHLPLLAKWVLIFCMLAGRLEYYTVLVILTPLFWRK